MRWIVASSLRFRFLVLACAAGMMLIGIGELRAAPVDVYPEFAPPRVEVQTTAIGLAAEDVESLVTSPLEQSLNGVPELAEIRSKSVSQLSSIELVFKQGTDLLQARQLVQERVTAATPTLPTWTAPPVMLQPLSATSRVMKIGLSSPQLSVMDMSLVAYWTIRARLLRVPGVANVTIWGEQLKMLQVQADPVRMGAHGVTLDRVMEATANSLAAGILKFADGARIGTGGFVDTPNQRLQIQHVQPIITPEDLAQVPVARQPGAPPLHLGDVANLVFDHQPLIGDSVINDGPGLMLVVEKLPWGNSLDVTHGVEAALTDMAPGLPGIQIDPTIFRPADFIDASIHNLSSALLLGSLLVVLVLGAFLFAWRSAVISIVTIPLSLMAAGLVLYLTGATINTMILAGLVIAVGVVVDDAIIDVENIVRRLRAERAAGSDRSTARIVLGASVEVRSAIIYATLINVVAVLPVFTMQSLTGTFFKPLVFAYALAVLASLVVALTVTPALALLLLAKAPLQNRQPPLVRWLQAGYRGALVRVVRSPRPVLATVGLIAVVGVTVLPLLGQELFPAFKERDFLIHWVTKPGTSQPEENRITVEVSRELRAIPGVRNFGSHIGQALLADEVVGINAGENWISIDPSVDYDETLAAIQDVVERYPGLRRDVQTYLKERTEEVLAGAGEAIVVRINGPDLDVLRNKADEVRTLLSGTPGVVEEHVELQEQVPQIDVEVDLAAAQRYGVKPGDVRRAAATLMAGEEVGDIFRDGKTYDVQVWSPPEARTSLSDVRSLLIDTQRGQVRLADVADVRVRPTPNVVIHHGGERTIDVGANVRGRDLGSVAADVAGRLRGIAFPLGYHPELLGEFAEAQSATNRLLGFAAAAAAGIFLVLVRAFRSWRLATLAFLTLPAALVGGVLGAFAGGGIISLGSLVGFLAVLGIAARNAVMLISHYQHLERYEGETFGLRLVLRGAAERLAPILMTALATGLAVVPLVAAGSIPGHEIELPMATVILGGLVTATLLNLFILPALYLRFGKSRKQAQPR